MSLTKAQKRNRRRAAKRAARQKQCTKIVEEEKVGPSTTPPVNVEIRCQAGGHLWFHGSAMDAMERFPSIQFPIGARCLWLYEGDALSPSSGFQCSKCKETVERVRSSEERHNQEMDRNMKAEVNRLLRVYQPGGIVTLHNVHFQFQQSNACASFVARIRTRTLSIADPGAQPIPRVTTMILLVLEILLPDHIHPSQIAPPRVAPAGSLQINWDAKTKPIVRIQTYVFPQDAFFLPRTYRWSIPTLVARCSSRQKPCRDDHCRKHNLVPMQIY